MAFAPLDRMTRANLRAHAFTFYLNKQRAVFICKVTQVILPFSDPIEGDGTMGGPRCVVRAKRRGARGLTISARLGDLPMENICVTFVTLIIIPIYCNI